MDDLLFGGFDPLTGSMTIGADTLGITAGDIAQGLIASLVDALVGLFESIFEPVFALICSPISFDFAADLTLGFQGAALGIVFLIILGRGITKGIIGSATDDDMDVVRYVWRSLVPIGAIILAPSVAAIITSIAAEAMGYVAGQGALDAFAHNLAALTLNISLGPKTAIEDPAALVPSLSGLLIALIAGLAILWNVCALTLEIVKRWIQLAMMSIIIPLTAITSAIEDSSDVLTALKTMVGIVITIILQIVLFVTSAGVAAAAESLGLVTTLFLFIALLSAARSLPNWIDKFTYASGISGGGSGRVLLLASRFLPKVGGGKR